MNFIKKIILILFILLCPVGTFAYDTQNNDFVKKTVITAPKHIEKDFIKNDIQYSHNEIIKNNSASIQRILRNNFNGLGNSDAAIAFENKFNFKNAYLEAFLDNKSKTTASLLLFQIQPNAP